VKRTSETMGVVSRSRYTPDSHIAWEVTVISDTYADAEDMMMELDRLCSEFIPTTTEKQIIWESGDLREKQQRFESKSYIFVRFSGMKTT